MATPMTTPLTTPMSTMRAPHPPTLTINTATITITTTPMRPSGG